MGESTGAEIAGEIASQVRVLSELTALAESSC